MAGNSSRGLARRFALEDHPLVAWNRPDTKPSAPPQPFETPSSPAERSSPPSRLDQELEAGRHGDKLKVKTADFDYGGNDG